MRKKAVDFICGLLMVAAFLGMFGAVGAFETDHISAGQCIVQAAACLMVCIGLGAFNALLMDAAEGSR